MDIDFALLADYAEVVGGKHYLMGGGWDTWFTREVPAQIRLSLSVGVRVGWDETNTQIPVRGRIEDDDGKVLVRFDAQVNVGRPAHLPPGSTQLAQLAANLPLQIQQFGGYRAVIEVGEGDGSVERHIPFQVVQRG